MFNTIIIILVSYLIGNFCTAYVIGRTVFKKDIREYGSGNAGATNALRVFGAKAGAIAFVGDALKGILAIIIGFHLMGYDGMILGGIFVAIGHNWPVFLKFEGGKGIATTIGVVTMIKPLLALFIIIFSISIVYKTKYVSLGSLIGSIILPIITIFLVLFNKADMNFLFLTLILSIMAVLKHRSNIIRLINGKERKLGNKV